MCRYSYISGACANRRVESIHCIGEDDCEYSNMNILWPPMETEDREESPAREWHRLYCGVHNKYLCDRLESCPQQAGPKPPRVSYRQQRIVDDSRGIW